MTNEHAKQIQRCDLCIYDTVYMAYHDKEWGIPAHDNNKLFESQVSHLLI
jgi:3-methyladenine DNA glycosylase Tag